MFEQLLLMAFGELQQTVMLQNDHICRLETRIDKLCNDKLGDVIEAGGTKHITYNNYYGTSNHEVSEPCCKPHVFPEGLNTEEAQIIKEKMVSAGMLDENWQPLNLSGPESALLAKAIGDRLGIDYVWQVFGQLWNIKPYTLRSYFGRAMNQKKSLDFQDKIKDCLSH